MLVAIGMGCANPPQEVEEGCGMSGDTKVRPGDEVELAYILYLIRIDLEREGGREGGRDRGREGKGWRHGGRIGRYEKAYYLNVM